MHCKPTNVLPAVIHPTKCCVNNQYVNNVVPHIHPTHTTNVNHINYDHVHYFPQTQSTVNQVTNQQFYGGSGPVPFGPRPRPGFGPVQGYGPGGFGPGAGMGMGPGTGYGPGMGFRR